MKKIIVISGKQYSGKDTLAQILLKKLDNFVRAGIGDAIKIQFAKENRLTFEQIEKEKHLYRAKLIEKGNFGRSIDPDYWLKSLINSKENIIVPDARVRHEIELFKSYGAYLIRIEAPFEIRSKRAVITNANDTTETDLDNFDGWNWVINNDSTYENLAEKAQMLALDIKKFFKLPENC